jgi:hypothetical protein
VTRFAGGKHLVGRFADAGAFVRGLLWGALLGGALGSCAFFALGEIPTPRYAVRPEDSTLSAADASRLSANRNLLRQALRKRHPAAPSGAKHSPGAVRSTAPYSHMEQSAWPVTRVTKESK